MNATRTAILAGIMLTATASTGCHRETPATTGGFETPSARKTTQTTDTDSATKEAYAQAERLRAGGAAEAAKVPEAQINETQQRMRLLAGVPNGRRMDVMRLADCLTKGGADPGLQALRRATASTDARAETRMCRAAGHPTAEDEDRWEDTQSG